MVPPFPNYTISIDYARWRAHKDGMDLVFPEDNVLQVDLDDPDPTKMNERLAFVHKFREIRKVEYTKSRNGNTHLYVTLTQPIETPTERLLLQTILGSDWKREMLSYVRAQTNEPPTAFYEKPRVERTPLQFLTLGDLL